MAVGMLAMTAATDPNAQKTGLIVSALVFVCLSICCIICAIWGKSSCEKDDDGKTGILGKAKSFDNIWGWITCLIPCLIPVKCLAMIMCRG
tara:strand:+ start:4588 stop:4860 length:273 start_codon:yes stop_codon:yes gene_type:complete